MGEHGDKSGPETTPGLHRPTEPRRKRFSEECLGMANSPFQQLPQRGLAPSEFLVQFCGDGNFLFIQRLFFLSFFQEGLPRIRQDLTQRSKHIMLK